MYNTIDIPKDFKRGKDNRWDEIYIPNWHEFEKLFTNFSNEWIFRGQRCSKWGLSSGIDRATKIVGHESAEDFFLACFKLQVSESFKNELAPSNKLEWLSLIQHYFAMTGLLDFTSCPYTASFFAFIDSVSKDKTTTQKIECYSVWAINRRWIKERAYAKIKKNDKYNNFSSEDITNPVNFKQIFGVDDLADKTFVLPLRPDLNNKNFRNERMKRQKGLFLRQSDPVLSFEDNLLFERKDYPKEHERRKYIKKFIIPTSKNWRNDVLSNLLQIKGIDEKFLFPGEDLFTEECKKILNQIIKKLESHAMESLKSDERQL